MESIKRFQIKHLFGNRDIDIRTSGPSLILVGQNGIGKSTVVNILYFFISRQWSRLMEYKFSEISITTENQIISARREDISGLSSLSTMISSLSPSSSVRLMVDKLIKSDSLEDFVSNPRGNTAFRRKFSELLGISTNEVAALQNYMFRSMSQTTPDLFGTPRAGLENVLIGAFPSRTLYLPTYRRIEKDLREIFPDFEERYRSHIAPNQPITSRRSSGHYIDLVNFGMEDVKENIDKKTSELRDYSLKLYNNLSGLYLRDVIRGNADKFTQRQINDLTDEKINDILNRVSEQTLPTEDKDLLRKKVKNLKGRKKSEVEINDKFLAHYFNRLVNTNSEIVDREADVTSFVRACNNYLTPGKLMVYDEIAFRITVYSDDGNEIDLKFLSSGEKQVISVFAHLYLDDTTDQIVIIDEPELSLSVPWQKRFLPDVLASKKCEYIVAVTHSPFIYTNNLRDCAVDLRRHTKPSEGGYL